MVKELNSRGRGGVRKGIDKVGEDEGEGNGIGEVRRGGEVKEWDR